VSGLRIAVIGGGPGGLYFAALAKQLNPQHEITVWERNRADDTFGFGVVFSDETLGGIEHADRAVYEEMSREFARWDDIDVHYRGEVVTSGGHGFAAMSRKRLLEILQDRCASLGVTVRFTTLAPDVDELAASHHLVVAADGLNSAVRARYAETFRPSLDVRRCKYMWLGTDKVFDAFKFYVRETPHGVMQIHGYPFDATASTFIVEMNDAVWERAGFDVFADRAFGPGESDDKSIALVRELFADVLEGHQVMANNSKWINFTTVRNECWRRGNVVLLGDAAHTAHFSIGSGT
jgi:anthraniloyl-CoA monooxygenase